MKEIFSSKNQKKIQHHLESLDYEFSDDQKSAIILCLYFIANSDNNFHEKEKKFLGDVASIINYDLESLLKYNLNNVNSEELFKTFSEFSEEEKDWFIITAFIMVYSDGIALMDEYLELEIYFEKMAITKDHWLNVIDSTKELLDL
jgi:hypothetical protein